MSFPDSLRSFGAGLSLGAARPGMGGVAILSELVAYWKLNEFNGQRNDSVGSNHLTDGNTVFATNTAGSGAAVFASASSKYLSVADNAALSAGNVDFSLSAWVNLTTSGSNRTIIAKSASTLALEYALEYEASSSLYQFRVSATGAAYSSVGASAFGAPSLGAWQHVVAWHDTAADTINIAVNDGASSSAAQSLGINNDTSEFNIGRREDATTFMDGKIDNVGVWKKVLSAAERTSLYASGSGKQYSDLTAGEKTSLQAWWNLDEASGSRADAHGTNHLADNNTVRQTGGKITQAAQFVAANSESLSVADNAALSTGNIDFTIACWVYFDSVAATMRLVQKGNGGNGTLEYSLSKQTSTSFTFSLSTNGTSGAASATLSGTIPTATWIFLVAWYDSVADTINLLKDDTTLATTSYSSGAVDRSGGMGIGAAPDTPAGYMDGIIDEVGFWKRVLTSVERTYLYNSGSGRTYPFT